MIRTAEQRLRQVIAQGSGALLRGGRIGLEKESLRVTSDGTIAGTNHPVALGSALTHPHITTDFSEALIELITPPFEDARETLEFLGQVHAFVYRHLDDELLWAASMPCSVHGDESVPIARYGSSNVGRMKHVYRQGLSHRYGRVMQAISGVHFNYSLPPALWPRLHALDGRPGPGDVSLSDYVSQGYFALIRNFQRIGWMLPYLFGTSPAVCKSFLGDATEGYQQFDAGTLYLPHATSLRMSDIGYKNKSQAGLDISYDTLSRYVESLTRAIETPNAEFEAIGVQVDGDYRQLNTNTLQIENEYYSFVRPKQITRTGEKPTLALKRRGVQYVEIRALDVNLFDPLGVNESQLRFLEAFLVLCLLIDSPPTDAEELAKINHNQELVARRGREPGLKLQRSDREQPLADWAGEILSALEGICETLDAAGPQPLYTPALRVQREAASDPTTLPSAHVLDEMRRNNESFFQLAMRLSCSHAERFAATPLDSVTEREFAALVGESHREQLQAEAADKISFSTYLRDYFKQSAVPPTAGDPREPT